MSMTVAVFMDGIGGMNKSDYSTWATSEYFPNVTILRRMHRTGDGKALTVKEAAEYCDIPVVLKLKDNMVGDLNEHFLKQTTAIKEVIIAQVADRNDKSSKAINKLVMTDVIIENLEITLGNNDYVISTILNFQTLESSYGNGTKQKDMTWNRGVRQS